ncbi:MAG: hypothetical protein RIC55_13885 [Pirellulaceae bacterium]
MRQTLQIHRVVSVGCLSVLALLSPTLARAERPVPVDQYEVKPRQVSLIPPGTVIDEKAPQGWSHLIIRSHPRVAPEDRSKVNSLTAQLASLLFTAVAAKVEAYTVGEEQRYRFKDVGVGFGAPIDGRPTIVSPDTQARLGANLSFFGRQVLSTCYEEQKAGRIICYSDTMAVVDTRVVLNRNGKHRWCIFRHALLIDPSNGALATLLWPIDLDDSNGRYAGVAGPVQWLPPNKIEDTVLRVDTREFTLGVPSKKAFAVAEMPDGERQLQFPEGVEKLAGLQQMTPETAHATEMWLWEMVRRDLKQR